MFGNLSEKGIEHVLKYQLVKELDVMLITRHTLFRYVMLYEENLYLWTHFRGHEAKNNAENPKVCCDREFRKYG